MRIILFDGSKFDCKKIEFSIQYQSLIIDESEIIKISDVLKIVWLKDIRRL